MPSKNKDELIEPLLTINQTSNKLQVSTKTVRREIQAKRLIAHRIGHQWRISPDDLLNYIRQRRQS